ncbi:hypothetical protein CEXT_48591 [Caerostris extrusa]|uniref:Uncharacterized protein n=1 Tax=Caerostris extrusa TaxID=172846 RepID=A0AAV4N1T0_CAEEX|nr:hypothetical protein CEXT_48591 [Caerostris extrusa]
MHPSLRGHLHDNGHFIAGMPSSSCCVLVNAESATHVLQKTFPINNGEREREEWAKPAFGSSKMHPPEKGLKRIALQSAPVICYSEGLALIAARLLWKGSAFQAFHQFLKFLWKAMEYEYKEHSAKS